MSENKSSGDNGGGGIRGLLYRIPNPLPHFFALKTLFCKNAKIFVISHKNKLLTMSDKKSTDNKSANIVDEGNEADKKAVAKKSVFELDDAKGEATLPTTPIAKTKVIAPTPPAVTNKGKGKGKADKEKKNLPKTEPTAESVVDSTNKGITKEDVVEEAIAETAITQEPKISDSDLDVAVVAEATILDVPSTDSEIATPPIENKEESTTEVVEAPKSIAKSAEQIAYENEVAKFNSHIENTCKFWYKHCLYLSHQEKHSITSLCTSQGISVTFTDAGQGDTKVLFTKGKTAYSFVSKTIFW